MILGILNKEICRIKPLTSASYLCAFTKHTANNSDTLYVFSPRMASALDDIIREHNWNIKKTVLDTGTIEYTSKFCTFSLDHTTGIIILKINI